MLSLVYISCSRELPCKAKHTKVGFEVLQTIDIKLYGTQYHHVTPNVFETDTAVLMFGLDPFSHRIDVYSLTHQKFLYSTNLQTEGPQQIVSPKAIFVHNPDSVFIFNDINQLYLVNRNGLRLNYWNFEFELPDSITNLDPAINGSYIIAAYGKHEYLNLPFMYDKHTQSILVRMLILNSQDGSAKYSVLYKTPCVARINLTTGLPVQFFGKYPLSFLNEPKPHNPFAHFAKIGSNIWIQFDSSDEIYSLEQDTFFCSRSLYAREQRTLFSAEEAVDEEKEIRTYHTDEAYLGIYFDPYQKLVYRVFQLGQPDKDMDGRLNLKLQAPFSVIILRPDGEIIGEALFESGKYNFLDFFVTSKGILISKETPFNTENEEELYSFDLIKFKI